MSKENIESYKGVTEEEAGVAKANTWSNNALIPALAVGVGSNWENVKAAFSEADLVDWSKAGKYGLAAAVAIPVVAATAGYYSGKNQGKEAHQQYDDMARSITALSSENEALKATNSWADKVGKNPQELFVKTDESHSETASREKDEANSAEHSL